MTPIGRLIFYIVVVITSACLLYFTAFPEIPIQKILDYGFLTLLVILFIALLLVME